MGSICVSLSVRCFRVWKWSEVNYMSVIRTKRQPIINIQVVKLSIPTFHISSGNTEKNGMTCLICLSLSRKIALKFLTSCPIISLSENKNEIYCGPAPLFYSKKVAFFRTFLSPMYVSRVQLLLLERCRFVSGGCNTMGNLPGSVRNCN